MISEEYIQKLVEEKLENTDLFLVELNVSPNNKIDIFIDSEGSVKIEDCIALSKFVELKLDREKEDFELHVSSAGLDRPLKVRRQYKKNIEKNIRILLFEDVVVSGILKQVNELTLVIEREKSKKKKTEEAVKILETISFSDIKETKVIISF